ncbi:fatty acyl-CoA reductase 1 isoform X2 [Parasteatoda tepidariorum]|uniref:fatty acyl-CoA reductase 1 isoform X2 n=1 Tax=Parasteatoda tepidariorum TaxID=114398 RepID=UPI001C71E9C5|nr:fatty acyl-CoA reductase 1 isoform X2 [Parasteatoda tepidariorum]
MSETNTKQYKRVSEFYDEKTLFITGAAGFLGSVLLEVLLRCLPGIKNIFILLRSKKGVLPNERKKLIFQKRVFCKLLEENPNAPEKVIVVEGDISEPNLGMSDEDFIKVTNEATIIFHVAATISFIKPLRYIAVHNCVGVKNVIELGRKMKNLEALVYTSTAYSNSNRSLIEEIIYRLPWNGERFLKALESDLNNEFEKLAADCKPKWPNSYTFSKCLSENIIADMASDLPVIIIRPSVIATIWKSPLQGYVEEGSGVVDLPLGIGKGFIRVLVADMNSRFDLVPVDIVANVHVAAAWSVATERLPSLSIINCTGGPWNVTFELFSKTLKEMAFKQLIPKSFQMPSIVFVNNAYLYKLLALYEHYLPAYVFDAILYLKGSKFRLVKLYKFLDGLVDQLIFFLRNEIDFKQENYIALAEQMDPRDKETYPRCTPRQGRYINTLGIYFVQMSVSNIYTDFLGCFRKIAKGFLFNL